MQFRFFTNELHNWLFNFVVNNKLKNGDPPAGTKCVFNLPVWEVLLCVSPVIQQPDRFASLPTDIVTISTLADLQNKERKLCFKTYVKDSSKNGTLSTHFNTEIISFKVNPFFTE